MPKQRITKEMVLSAAFKLLRQGGESKVLVKSIAAELSCSVQPIYSYCKNMDTLRDELSQMAANFMKNYVSEHHSKLHYVFIGEPRSYEYVG